MQVLSHLNDPVPYTVVIFILGAICSALADVDKEDVLSESIYQWINIDAELLLFVFLPPLVFGEAMSLNWHHVKGGILQAVILAGPGVLIGAVLMGCITKGIVSGWSWYLSMTFGSILAATDPVAVVALLKSAGASPTLTILIVGESLLNDGTAIVLFELFFDYVDGHTYSAGQIVAFFVEAALGSVLLGMGFGLLTVRWLRSCKRRLRETDVTAQVAITFICSYLVFFVAQYVLQISGVLACCGAGGMIAWLGYPLILNHETMHSVWGMTEWTMNTLIFLLAGLLIGHRTLLSVRAVDWLLMLVLYVMLMLVRAVVNLTMYPFISRIGHRCSPNEAVFMTWAGLRGALAMALALTVKENGPPDLEEETSRFFFYVGGIAALTLLINATTANKVLTYLGLSGSESAEKMLMMSQIRSKLKHNMEDLIEQMSGELTERDIEEIKSSCSLLLVDDSRTSTVLRPSEDLTGFSRSFSNENDAKSSNPLHPTGSTATSSGDGSAAGNRPISAASAGSSHSHRSLASNGQVTAEELNMMLRESVAVGSSSSSSSSSRPAGSRAGGSMIFGSMTNYTLLGYVRSIFLEIVRAEYRQLIESGKLPRLSYSAQFLLYTVDVAVDLVHDPAEGAGADYYCMERGLNAEPYLLQALRFLERVVPGGAYVVAESASKIEADRIKRRVYMLTSFIEAHESAQKKLHEFLDVGVPEGSGGPTAATTTTTRIGRSSEEKKTIEESQLMVEKAKQILSSMDASLVAAIQAKQMSLLVLAKEADMVKHLVEEGLLTDKHAGEFFEMIDQDAMAVEKSRNKMIRERAKKSAAAIRSQPVAAQVGGGSTSGMELKHMGQV